MRWIVHTCIYIHAISTLYLGSTGQEVLYICMMGDGSATDCEKSFYCA